MNTIQKPTIQKQSSHIQAATLVVILTLINLVTPPSFLFYTSLFAHTFFDALGRGLFLGQYFPIPFLLAAINCRAILYYKSILRPHLTTNVLFLLVLCSLFINMLYYVIGFLHAIYTLAL
jgi:hypothetical protein